MTTFTKLQGRLFFFYRTILNEVRLDGRKFLRNHAQLVDQELLTSLLSAVAIAPSGFARRTQIGGARLILIRRLQLLLQVDIDSVGRNTQCSRVPIWC
jgi:hypothetical protein